MGSGFSDAALAVFTTLAPLGACAFIVIAAALAKGGLDAAALKRLDKATLIPLVVCVVGFIGAALHVANPLAAVNVFAGIGRSPLSNEVIVGLVFLVLAIVYWICAWTGVLKGAARTGFAGVLGVLGVVFAVFCGMAYLIPTVPTWNTPWTVAQMLGYGLVGGSALGALTLCAAGIEFSGAAKKAALAAAVIGAVFAIVGFGGQLIAAGGMANINGVAIDLVPAAWAFFALVVIASATTVLVEVFSKPQGRLTAFSVVALVVIVCVFFARIGFYGLFMSVAL